MRTCPSPGQEHGAVAYVIISDSGSGSDVEIDEREWEGATRIRNRGGDVSTARYLAGCIYPYVLLVIFVTIGSVQSLSFVRMGRVMRNPLPLLLIPNILILLALGVLSLATRAVAACVAGEEARMRKCSLRGHRWYAAMGLANFLSAFFLQVADSHVEGTVQIILSQLTIPITFVLSLVFLKREKGSGRNLLFPAAGAGLVCAGCVLVCYPQLVLLVEQGPSKTGGGLEPMWVMVSAAGTVPLAALSVIQESAFSPPNNLAPLTSTVFMQVYSTALAMVVVPISSLWNGAESWQDFMDGCACLLGAASGSSHNCLHPQSAWHWPVVFSCAFALYAFLGATLVVTESALFLAMAWSMITPVTALAFAIEPVAGPAYQRLTWITAGSAVISAAGMVLYRGEYLCGAVGRLGRQVRDT